MSSNRPAALGLFLLAAAECYPNADLRGFDIKSDYVEAAARSLSDLGAHHRAVVRQQDFFTHDWDREMQELHGAILILGNLPWVTSQTVASINGSNVPTKENFQGFRGIAARTGKSNFDISEWMLIRLVNALRGKQATIAMLCKTGTARKLLRYGWQNDGRIASASLYQINAKADFGASVDACLLVVQLGEAGPAEAALFESLHAPAADSPHRPGRPGLRGRIDTYQRLHHLEGLCPYQWRSGIKHDCASVMELRPDAHGVLRNKLGERVVIEPDYLYPLLKCSDLANGRSVPERMVVVTQKRVGDDTSMIASQAPCTWEYLTSHSSRFTARKSSIYKEGTPFALFGIGDYTFAPWKVAVSGLHHHPLFMLVPPCKGKPVLFDDTCYFLSFADEEEARFVADILNSEPSRALLEALMFDDAKRPITVELLQRLNLCAIAEQAGMAARWRAVSRVRYSEATQAPQMELVMERAKSAAIAQDESGAGQTERPRLQLRNPRAFNNYPWPQSVTDKQRAAVEAAAQAVLDARAQYPTSTLADLYDPLTMPAPLLKAHQQLDRAVDRCYRPEPFPSDRHRVEYLFALYEKLTAPLVAAAKPARKGRKPQTAS